jgi:thiol-disulfide isomerase/thioredoxin
LLAGIRLGEPIDMSVTCLFRRAAVLSALVGLLATSTTARGQDLAIRGEARTSQGDRPIRPDDENIKSIDDDYARQLVALERGRLERLERLAARQNPADAAVTYERLFRVAIAANLFRDAEPAAKTVVSSGSPSLVAEGLAHLVKIIAEVDRGAYEQSLESLQQAVEKRAKAVQGGPPRAELPTDEVVGICDAYYQRLIQGSQYENARKALKILLGKTQRPALKEYLTSRLRRLDQVGKPAPSIQGTDLDHKPFDLAKSRGKAVLVVFWASWSLPSAAEVAALQQVEEAYRGRGFEIVGINLDALSEEGQKPDSALPNIRHFLLDYNVRWPTLINGQGDKDYAKAYGVTEIPANVLIGKDGTVVQIDLVSKNLESSIARAVGN